jgi:hypothetical protein
MALHSTFAGQADISVVGYSNSPGEMRRKAGIESYERRRAIAERELGAGTSLLVSGDMEKWARGDMRNWTPSD